ncbi:lauroyl-Kdo(2)-lipid IV(A) myristoyltransferase, partial [Pectobacterium brasiliense]|nr:lauroyl-Kdo(2)-lipid IV(A) myristoyltransferase [Pectobacterium brasiliense]
MEKEKQSNAEFVPQFQRAYFHPRYWAVWLGVGVMALAAYVPARLRNTVL